FELQPRNQNAVAARWRRPGWPVQLESTVELAQVFGEGLGDPSPMFARVVQKPERQLAYRSIDRSQEIGRAFQKLKDQTLLVRARFLDTRKPALLPSVRRRCIDQT